MKVLLLCILLLFFSLLIQGQPPQTGELPEHARIMELLRIMHPQEKFRQLFMIPASGEDTGLYRTGIFGLQLRTEDTQSDVNRQVLPSGGSMAAYEDAVRINEIQRRMLNESRMGIPLIFFDEALHGLVRPGATAFPQSIGLAATFNLPLMRRLAGAIALECRSRGIRQVLSPVINIATDVRWGRTEETYGEDPFLVTEMGLAYVSAFESAGVIATPKHFIANVGDGGRDSYPVHWNERLMREDHYPPFEACIERGGAQSVMTAYNSFDGSPCTASEALLNGLLKKTWGFGGFVISDAAATGGANVLHFTAADYAGATVQAMTAGLDVIFQTSLEHENLFAPPFRDGDIPQAVIDSAVSRVLKSKLKLDLFQNPYCDSLYASEVNGCAAHRRLALEAARESMVLLKNERQILPLSPAISSIAVTGPDAAEARPGGYSGPGNSPVSILEGIRNRAGSGIRIAYARGCNRTEETCVTIPSEALSCLYEGRRHNGLLGRYYNNITLAGKPVIARIDPQLEFQWTLYSPDPAVLANHFYSVSWTGRLHAPGSGLYRIGIDGNDGYRLYLNDSLLLDRHIPGSAGLHMAPWQFLEGDTCDIRVEYAEPLGNSHFRLVWDYLSVTEPVDEMSQAVKLAAECDLAVVVAGIEEGEFRDRASLRLPGRQEELILKVAETGTPVVVVIVGGSAVTMPAWIDRVSGILMAWYPGEQGGNAVADVLFGRYNPAGRLPVSFPQYEGQLPLVYRHKPSGRGDDYLDMPGRPLFPFGYGLSYTTFGYSGLQLDRDSIRIGDTTYASLKITNTGMIAGDEVVQLYIRDELASVARPLSELKGFQRISLLPGESKKLRFLVTPEMLTMLDKNLQKTIEPGTFRIMAGASSADIRQQTTLTVTGPFNK